MALKKLTKEQVIDRLRFENPWWRYGKIEEFHDEMQRRLYFNLFKPLVHEMDVKRAVVLMGPRRVGKTVMIYHTIQDLIESGIEPNRICYFSIETPIYNKISLEEMFEIAREASGYRSKKGWFIFFDEIQYLKEWEIHLKTLVDSYRENKFVASGSASAALKLKSTESGAGRFTDFLLPPLTFIEYIHLKKLDNYLFPEQKEVSENMNEFYVTSNIKELNEHFIDYINFGGYPEVIFSEKIRSNPGRYIRHDIIDKVLLRDLPSLYGIPDVQELNSLFTTIAYNTGNEFSLEELSKSSSGVQKNTLKRYIEYLEAAFLIKKVRRIDNTAKKFKRDNFFKLYLTNPSLRSALFSPIATSDELIGNQVETAIFAQWIHNESFTPWYSRWNRGEVDMVSLDEKKLKPRWALEIKWSNRFFDKPGELKSLIHFCNENKLNSALVTTIDKEGIKKINKLKIQFVPASIYSYTVGRLTFKSKLNTNKMNML